MIVGYFYGLSYDDFSEQLEVTELFLALIFSYISGEASTTDRLYLCHLNILDKFIKIVMYFLHLNTSKFFSWDLLDYY